MGIHDDIQRLGQIAAEAKVPETADPRTYAPKATRDLLEQQTNLRTASALNAVQSAMRHRGTDVWTERDVQTSRIIAAALHQAAQAGGEGITPAGAKPEANGSAALSAVENALAKGEEVNVSDETK